MRDEHIKRNTAVFIGLLLLAGLTNLFTRTGEQLVNTLMFCLNFSLIAGLLLFWMDSVRRRLLPVRARSYILASAWFMLLHLLLRIVKYRIVTDSVLISRYIVYGYDLSIAMMPTLFLLR